jgi:methyl-accepting chemotaxis protein
MIKKSLMIVLLVLIGFAMIVCIASCDRYGINLKGDRETIRLSARDFASEIGELMDNYIETLQSLSDEMSFYEDTSPEARRGNFENLALSVFDEGASGFFQLFSVWKPNAIDGMDSRYAGKAGSTETGQLAFVLTEGDEKTYIQTADSGIVKAAMEYLEGGPNGKTFEISRPFVIKSEWRNRIYLSIMVPILNARTNEPVGVIGCRLDIEIFQLLAEHTIKYNVEISSAVVYTNTGYILASYLPERIGMNMADREVQYGSYINDAVNAVKNAQEFECFSYDYDLQVKMFMCVTPVPLSDSPTAFSVMVGSVEDYVYRNVKSMGKTAITILVIAGMIGILIFVIIIDRKKKQGKQV